MDKNQDNNQQEEQIKQEDTQSQSTEHIENEDMSNQELTQAQSLAVQFEDKYKRAIADYQNLQRRTQEQKSEWIRSANRDLLLKLFPVLDTLMLAQKHTQDKGIELSVNQFLQILNQEGVTQIKTQGEMFDPHTMECVTTIEGEEGKVLEEVRAGFMLYDQVLRSAQVIVGKK